MHGSKRRELETERRPRSKRKLLGGNAGWERQDLPSINATAPAPDPTRQFGRTAGERAGKACVVSLSVKVTLQVQAADVEAELRAQHLEEVEDVFGGLRDRIGDEVDPPGPSARQVRVRRLRPGHLSGTSTTVGPCWWFAR